MIARLQLALFLAMFLVYFSTSYGVFLYGDDISMLEVTESMVRSHSISVPAVAFPFSTVGVDGNHYSKYGIGQSLVAIPFYVAGTLVGTVLRAKEFVDANGVVRTSTTIFIVCLLGMLSTAAVDVLIYRTSRLLGFAALPSFITAVCLGLGTFAWHYSRTFLAESTSMLCVFGAFYALLKLDRCLRMGTVVTFSLLMTCAFLLRVGNIGALLPMAGWFVGRLVVAPKMTVRRFGGYAGAWISIMGVGGAIIAAYNLSRFGNPLETGYGPEAGQFTTPLYVGLYGLILSSGKGLFAYAPILIAGCLGWVPLMRTHRSATLLAIAVVIAHLAFYARWYQWWGGGVWGPRFVVAVLPFMALGLPAILVKARTATQRWALGALALASVGLQVLSVVVPFDPYVQSMDTSPDLFERYLWDPAYSPLVAAESMFRAGGYTPSLAPVYYESAPLAVVQVTALLTGLILLACIAWALIRNGSKAAE